MNNKRDFINVLNHTALIYDKDLIGTVMEAYWIFLRHYEFDEFKKAMNHICRISKFWPKPSEIIEVIEKNRGDRVSIETMAEQQWRIVIDAVRKNGLNRSVKFDDKITQYLVNSQFTWRYLCGMKEENEKWEQKRFCEAYKNVLDGEHANFKIEDYNNLQKILLGYLPESQ